MEAESQNFPGGLKKQNKKPQHVQRHRWMINQQVPPSSPCHVPAQPSLEALVAVAGGRSRVSNGQQPSQFHFQFAVCSTQWAGSVIFQENIFHNA